MTGKSYSKRDIESLETILKFCEDISYFIQLYGSDEIDFQENISLQYGCVFSLIQIGEHAKRLSSEVRDEHPAIDWKSVAGMRDFIAHNYNNINLSRVRLVILGKIPALEEVCRSILNDS